jgi:DNA-binding YbaB/EbfC family protein
VIPGIEELMRQAQQMSQRMAELKQELTKRRVTGTAGGGMVTATASGVGELLDVVIEPGVVDKEDVEMLQDLVVAAVNQALQAAKQLIAEETRGLTGGMPIPGMDSILGGLGS